MNKSNNGFAQKRNRSSFQRTNKLLNKHGKAYRSQDVKSNKKRKHESTAAPNGAIDQTKNSQPQSVISQDHYAELLGSLKKKPRTYYEELLGESSEDGESGDEKSEQVEENTVASLPEQDEDEISYDESEEEEEKEEEEEEEDVVDYLKLNFGSDVVLSSKEGMFQSNVPHALYRIQKSSNVSDNMSDVKTLTDLLNLGIDPTLVNKWSSITKQIKSKGVMKPVSSTLFPYIAAGQDLLFTDSNFENQAELIKLLAFHCVNHALKTRKAVLKNNSKISGAEDADGISDDMRDQGFTRPKILVLFPFRNVAHKFVHQVLKIALTGSKKQVCFFIVFSLCFYF